MVFSGVDTFIGVTHEVINMAGLPTSAVVALVVMARCGHEYT